VTHARWLRQLSAYVDGELTPHEAGEVEAHLAQCESCRAELDRLQSLKSLLGRLPERPVPETLWTSVRAHLDQPQRSWIATLEEWLRGMVRRPALAAAALAIVALFVAIPLVRGRLERLRAAELGPELYIREHALASASDPFLDRAYLGLIISDASLALVGAPREETQESR
jgi:anti-sigma factor RsiW